MEVNGRLVPCDDIKDVDSGVGRCVKVFTREWQPIKATTRKVWSHQGGSLALESPSVICFRWSKVKFSASTAMMVSEEQMNAMREYSCLKPIYQTVLLLPDIFISSCQTVLLFWILGHWIMFHVQPFHIFAFYFVLCCGLVDFLKSSVFCENYTGAQGPPLFKKYR